MGTKSVESNPDEIYKLYADRIKNEKKRINQVSTEEKSENEVVDNQKAQEMVGKLFEKAETVSEIEYEKILTLPDLRLLIDKLDPKDLASANEALQTKGKNPDEVLGLLKKMLNGLDGTSGLQNRFALNDSLRQTTIDIITTKDQATKTEKMRHSGMIYFDVRGLKMVNDARHDHSDGDAFISRVADETRVVAEQIFAKILGDKAISGIFRDGGDEFAITLQDSKYDLEEIVTLEKVAEIFPETITITRTEKTVTTADGKKMVAENEVNEVIETRTLVMELTGLSGAESETTPLKLIDVLSKILELKMFDQKFVSEMFPREVIEKHLKKGRPNYENPALETFDMPILTAQGAQTNYDVFENTKKTYHKNLLSDEEISSLSASEIVNLFMSAMRLSADQRSYDAKNYQNRTWMESADPFQQLLIDLVSRNEITTGYADSLRIAKDIILDIHNENTDLKANLLELCETAQKQQDECGRVQDELEIAYTILEKKLEELADLDAELAKAKAVIEKIKVERKQQPEPDLTDGGGI